METENENYFDWWEVDRQTINLYDYREGCLDIIHRAYDEDDLPF